MNNNHQATTPEKSTTTITADHQKVLENHKKAAMHQEASAKNHHEAIKHHEAGNHELASHSTIKAHGHTEIALDAQKENLKHLASAK